MRQIVFFCNKTLITERATVFGKTFNLGMNIVPSRKTPYRYPRGNNLKTNSEVIVAKKSYFKKVPDEYSRCGKTQLVSKQEKSRSGMKQYKYNPVRKARSQNEDLILHQNIQASKRPFGYGKCGKTASRGQSSSHRRGYILKGNQVNVMNVGKPFLRSPPSLYTEISYRGETLCS